MNIGQVRMAKAQSNLISRDFQRKYSAWLSSSQGNSGLLKRWAGLGSQSSGTATVFGNENPADFRSATIQTCLLRQAPLACAVAPACRKVSGVGGEEKSCSGLYRKTCPRFFDFSDKRMA
jgi:hypothetical protein